MTGVYCIRHMRSGKNYVGSAARCLVNRLRDHVYELDRDKHHNRYLQAAWTKYGKAAFRFEDVRGRTEQKVSTPT